mmetsp:Transcript_10722/g.31260  ORF Transcript_10722/g.31260 Transcript_10722/m.31260 type:complete len:119 (-) Transcript_10722:2325-2681(-)
MKQAKPLSIRRLTGTRGINWPVIGNAVSEKYQCVPVCEGENEEAESVKELRDILVRQRIGESCLREVLSAGKDNNIYTLLKPYSNVYVHNRCELFNSRVNVIIYCILFPIVNSVAKQH